MIGDGACDGLFTTRRSVDGMAVIAFSVMMAILGATVPSIIPTVPYQFQSLLVMVRVIMKSTTRKSVDGMVVIAVVQAILAPTAPSTIPIVLL